MQRSQIYYTRSFEHPAHTIDPILEAVSLYASRAAEKLRKQRHLVGCMQVFIHTSPHKPNYRSASEIVQLAYPTDDSRVLVDAARATVKRFYKEGYAYIKAGIGLLDLVDKAQYQPDLFSGGPTEESQAVMAMLDKVNTKLGKGVLFLGAQGVRKPWYMKQQYCSPQYTTRWGENPEMKAM